MWKERGIKCLIQVKTEEEEDSVVDELWSDGVKVQLL